MLVIIDTTETISITTNHQLIEFVFTGMERFAKNIISYLDACSLTTPLMNIITYTNGSAGPNNAKAVNTFITFM